MKNFNEIYAKNYGIIFNFVNMKLHNIHDSEEVTNDVFMKANENFDKFDANLSKFETWLYNIAKNTVIDFVRTNHQNKYVKVSDFVNSETGEENFQFADDCKTDDLIENKELKAKIDLAMNNLKPKYKRIAELYFLQDKPYNEIAKICEIPLNSVKGMINRVRTMLQSDLKNIAA